MDGGPLPDGRHKLILRTASGDFTDRVVREDDGRFSPGFRPVAATSSARVRPDRRMRSSWS
jgi:hypothetical protein